jgi:hypothetical protein
LQIPNAPTSLFFLSSHLRTSDAYPRRPSSLFAPICPVSSTYVSPCRPTKHAIGFHCVTKQSASASGAPLCRRTTVRRRGREREKEEENEREREREKERGNGEERQAKDQERKRDIKEKK